MCATTSATRSLDSEFTQQRRSLPNKFWIRSLWQVRSPKGESRAADALLHEALARGIAVDADPKRKGFFEVIIEERWFYFHVREGVECVYLIASAVLGKRQVTCPERPAEPSATLQRQLGCG